MLCLFTKAFLLYKNSGLCTTFMAIFHTNIRRKIKTTMRMCYLSLFVALSCSFAACSQSLRFITNLPADLSENSGMILGPQGQLWLHNDSGDSAKLYLLDTFGTLVRTLSIDNATHVDWEDLTRDPQGRVYIGDIGNNRNNRQDLVIYRLPNIDTVTGSRVRAEAIRFYYPEQTAYPPSRSHLKYDAEALIYHQDSLYIFTKDRTTPHRGYTWLYQIPADTGYHAAVLLDSFQTGQRNVIFEVTGAALSPNGQQLALLGANRVWVFQHFTGADFFGGSQITLNLGTTTQKEAITFVDDHELYISNENSPLGMAKLHALSISNWVGVTSLLNTHVETPIVSPNPALDQLTLRLNLARAGNVVVTLHELDGTVVKRWTAHPVAAGVQDLYYGLPPLPAGTYVVAVKMEGHCHLIKVMIGQ